MTRHKIEFEIAVQDDRPENAEQFKENLNEFLGHNVPAKTGWSLTKKAEITEVETFLSGLTKSPDPHWKAILAKVATLEHTHLMRSRGTPYKDSRNSWVCHYEGYARDRKEDGTYDLFVIKAWTNQRKEIVTTVSGPYIGYSKDYWEGQANRQHHFAVITPDWVHRTISKDDPQAVASGGGGHGGAEFRFILHEPNALEEADNARALGLTVVEDGEDNKTTYTVVTHNCWYQGIIPPQMRHLFKVNAEMVTGFNPCRIY